MKSEKVKLESVCKRVVSGGTPKSTVSDYYNGSIPWLNTKEVHFNRIYSTEKTISDDGLKNSSAKWIPSHCVIIAMYGATAGNVAINMLPLTTNQACCNLELDEEKADFRYIYYYLKYKYMDMSLLANGGAQQNLNAKIIKDFPISLPELKVQRKIASMLWSLDDKIAINNKINKNLEQQAQALYHEWFECVDRNNLPSGWKIITLDEIAEISKKVFNPAKEQEIMLEHYSIPAFDERKFPVFEMSSQIKSNKYIVDNSCLLISKLNPTIKRVWKPYCLTNNAVCSTEFIVYRAKDKELTDFLYSVIDSATFSDFMCSHVTGSTGSRQRTTPTDTLAFELVLPKTTDIQGFQHIVSPMYEQMKNNVVESQKLMQLRDSLLPKLMNGEIDTANIAL